MALFVLIFFFVLALYGFWIDRYRRVWNAIPEYHPTTADVSVSVVVAVRDEAANIAHLLRSLQGQDYPDNRYEVWIVDDHSTDNTLELAQQFSFPGLNLHILSLPAGTSSKKSAIAAGVARASGELILTTDADCTLPATWISTLASFYRSTGAACIAAPVLMVPETTCLGIFQCLDFLTLQGITGAGLSRRMHIMGNGANLAYTRDIFLRLNGFEHIDAIPSGDDMLLMQKIEIAQPGAVQYLKSRAATVTTYPEKRWKDFLNQRIRWASKSLHYKDKRIFYVLLVVYLCNLGFIGLLAAALAVPGWWPFFLLFCAAKLLVEFPFVNSVAIYFRQQRLMKYFALLQPVHILYTLVAGWLGSFGSYRWKGRVIKNSARTKPAKP